MVLALSMASFAQAAGSDNKPDRDKPSVEKPDHCGKASEKVRDAANEVGTGRFGDAAHSLGEAAGAARMCRDGKKK
jgi:hypothetical protein